jgi:IclR family transcriptional regulator, acetate operon repressor
MLALAMPGGALRETSPTPTPGRNVQSVTRAIALIASLVDNGEGLTLSELARSAGLSVSTAHRLLHSLCEGEVLCRDPVTERFIPGPLLMRLARSSIINGGLGDAAQILQELTDSTRETASFGIRDGESVLVMLATQSPEPLRFERRVGSRLALHSSALGRALLAHGTEPAQLTLERTAPLARSSPATKTDPAEVLKEVQTVLYRGWAWVEEEHDIGVHALAVPIRASNQPAHAAVALEIPSARVTRKRIESLGRELLEAAGRLKQLPISMAAMSTMRQSEMPPLMLG